MALWHCAACTAAYAVGLERCPQCGSTERTEDGGMAKISAAGPSTGTRHDTEPPVTEAAPGSDDETRPAESAGPEAAGDAGTASTPPAAGPTPAPAKPPKAPATAKKADGDG